MISSIVRMLSCSRFDRGGGTLSRERVETSLVVDSRCCCLGPEADAEAVEFDREGDGRLRPSKDAGGGCADREGGFCDLLRPLGASRWPPEPDRDPAAFSRRWRSSRSTSSFDLGGFSPLSRPGSAFVTSSSLRSVRCRSRTKSCCCCSRFFSRSWASRKMRRSTAFVDAATSVISGGPWPSPRSGA